MFRGVIGPMSTRSGWLWPVAKDYRKQKQEFVLVNRPGMRRVGDVSITFAPAIRVNADFTDFRSDFTRIFQTLNVRNAGASTNTVTRQFSSTERTKVSELLSSLFSTFGTTVREITRATYREREFHAKTQSSKESRKETAPFLRTFASLRENNVTTTNPLNMFTHVSELKLFTSSKTNNSHERRERWLLLRSKDTEREVESLSTTNLFTTLSLNFASPKVSETELVHQQIARFASSPDLTYPKRQQAMSEGIVQALRSLRTSEPEPKRTAAPVQLPSIEQITNEVKTQLEREIRIERERRGL
ncbi:MAG TPA: hypothetical protein VJT69_08370 [Pyrinomonadaceae bacterium]|nr:hypothetical protein [Pyrinomonadaceae bacterium]